MYARNSLVVQWLGHHILFAKGLGSIPGGGTNPTDCRMQPKKKKKKKSVCFSPVKKKKIMSYKYHTNIL